MANARHVAKLREGAEAWNSWRAENPGIAPDLSDLDLPAGERHFGGAQPIDFSGTNLRRAALAGADLAHARLESADLSGADLREANLAGADLSGARLAGANVSRARLEGVRNLTQEGVDRAQGCADTVLPDGLTVPPGWLGDEADVGPGKSSGRASGCAVEEAADDPHSVLGVSPRASQREIRAAYLRLVKELHPDGRPRDAVSDDREERLKQINDAYQALKGSGRREEARKAERRRRARRASAVFVAGVMTSMAPVAVALVAGAYYAGWIGTPETPRSSTAATPEQKSGPGLSGPVSEVGKKTDIGRRTAWAEAHKLGTREGFRRFLADYPDGETAMEAKAAIVAIERAERQRNEAANAWAQVEKRGAKGGLERFVSAYPDSEHAPKARERIAAIDRAEARRNEAETAWPEVESSGAKGELERFAAAYPDSELASLARAKIAAIERAERRRNEAEKAWASAESSGAKGELERFLAAYPESEHVSEARERVAAIERAEARERAEAYRIAEAKAWAATEKEASREGLERFVAAYPDGEHAGPARQALAAALAAEETERETATWLKAERRHSKAAYAGYLAAYPDGRRAADARLRMAELERAEAKLAAEPVKSAAAPAAKPEGQGWPSADEPFVGADGRIRR